MPNNTETYWEADGQSLHTFARSIETLGGMGVPDLRGDDFIIPLQPGEQWVPKVAGSNILTLAMWLRGITQGGNADEVPTKANYQSNWQDLVRLLWTPGRQLALTKRFYDGGVLRTATALAEFKGGLEPSMIGNKAARCTVDLKLADPHFYDNNTVSTPLPTGTTVVANTGNDYTQNLTFTINGARTGLLIENLTTGVQYSYAGTIASGTVVTLTPMNFTAMEKVGAAAAFDASIKVSHAGSTFWFNLAPGNNSIRVSSSSGTGTITLQAKGAWV